MENQPENKESNSQKEALEQKEDKEKAKTIAQMVSEKIKLPVEYSGYQPSFDLDKEIKTDALYAFYVEISGKPYNINIKPEELTEEKLKELARKKIQEVVDGVARDLENEYSGIKIVYRGVGMGGAYMFEVSCPDVIPSDEISDEPVASFSVERMLEEGFEKRLKKEARVMLEKYKSKEK